MPSPSEDARLGRPRHAGLGGLPPAVPAYCSSSPRNAPLGKHSGRVRSTGAGGSVGGVAKLTFLNLNRRSSGSAFASRFVSAGRSKRVSMKRRIEV